MDEPWKIDYQVNRRDFWLDQYFSYFYHPWVRCVMGLLLGSMLYAFAHRLLLTHSLAAAGLTLIPRKLYDWMFFVTLLLRLTRKMPPADGTCGYSATINAQRFYCAELRKAYRWKQIAAIQQTIEYTLFFTWSGATATIPNRVFGTYEEAQRFYGTARQYKYGASHPPKVIIMQDDTVWPPAPRR